MKREHGPTLVLVAAVLGLMLSLSSATATTYYVSTTGNDNNTGLSAPAAWQHVQYAANHVQAGDTVQVRGGVYNELVNIPVSGSATAGYITFQNYPGEIPIIDGTGLSIPRGQYGLFNIPGQSYIIIQGFEVRNYKSTTRNNVPASISRERGATCNC
jgi:hypothetical protein